MELSLKQKQLFQKIYRIALEKFKIHMDKMNGMPYELTACDDGMFYNAEKGCNLNERYNWTTSFVTGLAPLYYKTTENKDYLIWAEQFEKYYRSKVFDTPLNSIHDMGFLYVLYSIAMYNLTGDKAHKTDALKAADELSKRFSIKGKYIDSWNMMNDESEEGRAIVDCMMNLPLLLWAWKETGHLFYRDIADVHAETTLKLFVRDDDTVAHSFVFDRLTGELLGESNTCGYSNGSHWARGTAWATYGFWVIGEYMDKKAYTDISERLANAYIKALGRESKVPPWDFRLPEDIPAKKCGRIPAEWDETDPKNAPYVVDTSATAVMACAFLRMGREDLKRFAVESMEELCEKYVNEDTSVPGILHHQNGNMTYTTFGDYFLMEALSAILFEEKSIW